MAVSREQLYEEVWAEPMTKVAARYGVSSSFLARVCARLNVPRPPRGHWAKLAAGKASKRSELPAPQPGDELEWSRDGGPVRVARTLPKASEQPPRRRVHHQDLPCQHRLIIGAREHIIAGRETEHGYLKPNKRLLVDVYVSKNSVDRILVVANTLFTEFEARGHRVLLAPRDASLKREELDEREKSDSSYHYLKPWNPDRPTVVFIGATAFGLTLFELSKKVEVRYVNGKYVPVEQLPTSRQRSNRASGYTWTTTRDLPSGRFCVQAYSPYWRVKWKRQWQEVKAGDLSTRLKSIVRELEREALAIATRVEEANHQAELERLRWEEAHRKLLEEQAQKRRAKAINDSRDQLLNIISEWTTAKQIEAFLVDAEQRACALAMDARAEAMDRIQQARRLIGGTDALERLKSWKAPSE